jgi:HD-like signal output (HDOD) protein
MLPQETRIMDRSENIKKLSSLPPIPYVAHEILLTLNDSDANINKIAGALSREPGLTAKLVAMANSAFYMRQRPAYSVDEAIVRLGIARVRGVAVSILLAEQFDPRQCKGFKADRYWHDAVSTAFCATRLARYVTISASQEAMYLCGLVHNIGLLVLAYLYPREMSMFLLEKEANPSIKLTELEKINLGVDHHEASALLLGQWKMPEEIAVVSGQYPNRCANTPYTQEGALLAFSTEWAETRFSQPPANYPELQLAEGTLAMVAKACLNESEQIEHFARLLAGGA